MKQRFPSQIYINIDSLANTIARRTHDNRKVEHVAVKTFAAEKSRGTGAAGRYVAVARFFVDAAHVVARKFAAAEIFKIRIDMHANRIHRTLDDAIQTTVAMLVSEVKLARRRQLYVTFVRDALGLQKIRNRTAQVAEPRQRNFAVEFPNEIVEAHHLARVARIPKTALAGGVLVPALAAVDAFVLIDVDLVNGKIGFRLEHDDIAVLGHAIIAEHVLHRARHPRMRFQNIHVTLDRAIHIVTFFAQQIFKSVVSWKFFFARR